MSIVERLASLFRGPVEKPTPSVDFIDRSTLHALGDSTEELTRRMAVYRNWCRSLAHFPRERRQLAEHTSDRLLAAIGVAFRNENEVAYPQLADREDHEYYSLYPGDHYRLLAAAAREFRPERIVEFGTYTGMSSRIFCDFAPGTAKIDTFDVAPWTEFKSHLNQGDFDSGRITQHIDDLSNPAVFEKYRPLLEEVDLVFVDGPKDGVFEPKIFALLSQVRFKPGTVMFVDDIRFENMVLIWESIPFPKLDLTGFGHWSGTGFVELRPPSVAG